MSPSSTKTFSYFQTLVTYTRTYTKQSSQVFKLGNNHPNQCLFLTLALLTTRYSLLLLYLSKWVEVVSEHNSISVNVAVLKHFFLSICFTKSPILCRKSTHRKFLVHEIVEVIINSFVTWKNIFKWNSFFPGRIQNVLTDSVANMQSFSALFCVKYRSEFGINADWISCHAVDVGIY